MALRLDVPVTPATPTRPVKSRSRRGARLRHNLVVASFMAPAGIGIAVFFIYPLLAAGYFSFTKFDLLSPPKWFGLGNYRYMLIDPNLHKAISNTLWLMAVMVPAQILFALGAGVLLTTMRRSTAAYRTIFYLPALVPPVAGTLAFVYLLKPEVGPVNRMLNFLGAPQPLWFNSASTAKPSLVLLALWGIGNTMVIFLAALLDVPVSLYEAAALDGAGAWRRFRHVTLPTISPVILFSIVIGVIGTLQYFTQAAVAGAVASGEATVGGGVSTNFGYPQGSTFTYPLWLYVEGFRNHHLGYASALSVVLFFVAFSIVLVIIRRSGTFAGESA